MLDDVTPRFSRPSDDEQHAHGQWSSTGGHGGHGDSSSSGGERLRERTTRAAATPERATEQRRAQSSSTSSELIPIFSPLVQRLVLLALLGIMTLSSSVALAAASSLVRSPSSYLRSAAAAAAASSSSAVLTATRDHQHQHQHQQQQTLAHPQTAMPEKMQALIDLYCRGSLLHDVQVNHVFADSKHFVDMPVKPTSSAAAIPDEYRAYLEQIGPQWMLMEQKERILLLKVFLDQHFDAPGSDMAAVVPHDYQEDAPPPAIEAIASPAFQEWAFQLHKLWKLLGRVPLENVTSSFLHATPVADPALKRTQNVLVVPGGRFRESYYWDSYWIVEGLLVSNMKRTARGVVNNLLEYVAEFGFVPNGGRIYYLTRSQPPLLSDMVKLVAEAGKPDAAPGSHDAKTVDLDYLRAVVPILEKEYAFWMQLGPSSHAVEIEAPVRRRRSSSAAMPMPAATVSDATAETPKRFILNRFVAHADEPRPESYREDFHDATLAFKHTHGLDHADIVAKQSHLYNDIIAAAESGWDFTSRWFKDGKTMAKIDTSNVVPVDLNVMMHRVERNLAHFHSLLGDAAAASRFTRAAAVRAEAIQTLLWSNKTQSWHDYFLDTHTLSPIVAVSNYAPLWSDGLVDMSDPEAIENIIESFRSSGLIQVGGIQATTAVTGQQWDAPNAWPPSQDMVIEGLLALKSSKQAQHLARDLMRTWVKAGYVAWQKTGLMFEKYNATTLGGIGNGGEYIPQFGFGWTNGVILKYLAKHEHLLEGVDAESSSHA